MTAATTPALDRFNLKFDDDYYNKLSDQDKEEFLKDYYNRKYGGGMSAAELQDFETLVGRLEQSKMKQAGQLNRARQRDVFAGGLASMMGNF